MVLDIIIITFYISLLEKGETFKIVKWLKLPNKYVISMSKPYFCVAIINTYYLWYHK